MSRQLTLLLIVFIYAMACRAQSIHTKVADSPGHYGPQYHPPQFPQSTDRLYSYLAKNLHYPDTANELNIEGRVIVRFIVNETGAVSNIEVIRGIGGGCDEEAKRLVAAMPAWLPATYKGRAVKAVELLPILFKLE